MLYHLLDKYYTQTKSFIEEKNNYGQTPLMLAASLDDLEVELFLKTTLESGSLTIYYT